MTYVCGTYRCLYVYMHMRHTFRVREKVCACTEVLRHQVTSCIVSSETKSLTKSVYWLARLADKQVPGTLLPAFPSALVSDLFITIGDFFSWLLDI